MSNDDPGSGNPPLNAGAFLRQVLGEVGSNIGAVWVGGTGQLVPVFAQGLDESGLFDGVEGKRFLTQILSAVGKLGPESQGPQSKKEGITIGMTASGVTARKNESSMSIS